MLEDVYAREGNEKGRPGAPGLVGTATGVGKSRTRRSAGLAYTGASSNTAPFSFPLLLDGKFACHRLSAGRPCAIKNTGRY